MGMKFHVGSVPRNWFKWQDFYASFRGLMHRQGDLFLSSRPVTTMRQFFDVMHQAE